MTLKVIHRLQALSNGIRRTFVQHFARFQLTVCSHGSSAIAALPVEFHTHEISSDRLKLASSNLVCLQAISIVSFRRPSLKGA